MDENEVVEYGTLLFFRKDGQAGTPYPFCLGKTTIGASKEADIRLKLINNDLKPIHCMIDVNEYGIATIVNKSISAPVKVNGNIVRVAKVLNHRDEIEVVGKKFQYLNDDLCEEDTAKCEEILREVAREIVSPVKKRRSVVPVVQSVKRRTSLKSKTPVRRQVSKRESFAGFGSQFTVSVSPRKRLARKSWIEKCQTTSKVVAPRALGSPMPLKKRRLSLGNNPGTSKSNQISARNVLLSESTISSTTTVEDNESTFMKPSHTMKDIEEVKEAGSGFLDESNVTIDGQLADEAPTRKSSLKTPSRSCVKVIVTEATPQAAGVSGTPRPSGSRRVSDGSDPEEPNYRTSTSIKPESEPGTDTEEFQDEGVVITEELQGSTLKLENSSPNNSSRLSKGAKRGSSMEDEDLSSEESVKLNLSSTSSVSPIKGFSLASTSSYNAEEDLSPRRALLRKSLRKSQLVKEQLLLAEANANRSTISTVDSQKSGPKSSDGSEDESDVTSSNDSVFEGDENSSKPDQISRRSSSVEVKSMSSFSARSSSRRNSVPDKFFPGRRSANLAGFSVSSSSSESSVFLPSNTSPRRSILKKSLRDSQPRLTLNEKEIDESFDAEMETTPKTRHSLKELSSTDKSVRKSARKSKAVEEDVEEDTLSLEEDVGCEPDSSIMSGVMEIGGQTPSTESDTRKSLRKRSTPYKFSVDKSLVKADDSNLSLIASPIPKCESPFTPNNYSLRPSILKKSVRKSEVADEIESSINKNEDYSIRSRQSSAKKSQVYLDEPQSPVRDDFVNKSVRRTSRKNKTESKKIEEDQDTTDSSFSMSKPANLGDVKVLLTDCNIDKSFPTENRDFEDMSSEEDFHLVLSEGSKGDSSPEKSAITLDSTVHEESDQETPKSAIKSRRSKTAPYVPVTEDITPVSPIAKEKMEGGFKTPLNTPGLFENIRKSVLKSRSRTHKSSSSFMEELNKAGPSTKAVKRARESTGSTVKSTKRRKIGRRSKKSFGEDKNDTKEFSLSFDSFRSEEILSNMSIDNVLETPKHFSDLTDKPVINIPRTRSLTEPPTSKTAPKRRSLHAMRLESQLTTATTSTHDSDFISSTSFYSEDSDGVFEISSDADVASKTSEIEESIPKKAPNSPKNDLSDVAGLKRLLRTPRQVKSPKNDLSDLRGVKNILQTPRTVKTPKNDLRNVPNLKKFVSPKPAKTPKNDLENIVSFRKLLKTPKEVKTPKNDLRDVRGVRRILETPKAVNSPRNDLTDVKGVKKLMETPKTINSPKNDLTNVPNLRNLMSPKTIKSPKNDLKNIVAIKRLFESPKVVKSPKNDLTNVAGVKKLLSTPTAQNSPKNDLTNVPNLRKIMSPKQQNSPRNDLTSVHGVKRLMRTPKKVREPVNDLSNVEGVASIFNASISNESDIENNEDLFDNLFVKRPPKTYRGRSLSPMTRKKMLYKEDRKTLGDTPFSSPRVEKWVEEQAVMVSKTQNEEVEEPRSEPKKEIRKKPSRKQKRAEELEKAEVDVVESPKRTLRGRRKVETPLSDIVDDIKTDSPRTTRRKAGAKHVEKALEIMETKDEEKVVLAKRTLRGRRNAVEKQEVNLPLEVMEIRGSDEPYSPRRAKRGKKNVEEKPKYPLEIVRSEEDNKVESPKRTLRGKKNVEEKYSSEVSETDGSMKPPSEIISAPKKTRGRKKAVKVDEESNETIESTEKPVVEKRGRSKKAVPVQDDQVAEVDSTTSEIISSPAPKRGRPRKVAVVEEIEESTDSEIVSIPAKRGRPRNVAKEEKDSSADKFSGKRKRGKIDEAAEAEEKEEEVIEQVQVEPEKPVKATRGRPKKSTKQVEAEPAPEKVVNKRTRKAVKEEEIVVDSPRTRARKGDFNKYGDEFVVHSPRLEAKTKKKVQFEDESESDQGSIRKLRGRQVEMDAEDTKRPKRTRK